MKSFHARFPQTRLRRMRRHPWSRELMSEHRLSVKDLIYPIFVHEGQEAEVAIKTMPGIFRYSIDHLPRVLDEACELGIPAVALFPAVNADKKDAQGSESFNANNIVCKAIRRAKEVNRDLGVICDAALDPFTSHGHDGLLDQTGSYVLNEETNDILVKQSLVQCDAGCDVIAPSDMMDGRIGVIRKALDESGFKDRMILSYAAKYASAFYGPFRDAVQSLKLSGKDATLGYRDKRNYQMDPANSDEALREIALDIQEGADIVMVKPGLPYLDVVKSVSDAFSIPVAVYQVSGEYSMIKLALENGLMDQRIICESLLGFKRAGANMIFSYFAVEAARQLRSQA